MCLQIKVLHTIYHFRARAFCSRQREPLLIDSTNGNLIKTSNIDGITLVSMGVQFYSTRRYVLGAENSFIVFL